MTDGSKSSSDFGSGFEAGTRNLESFAIQKTTQPPLFWPSITV